jgi:hypothetical protein
MRCVLTVVVTALLLGSIATDLSAEDKAGKDTPPIRLSPTANGMGLRLQFAVKDLTPEQKKKSIPILQALDKEYRPLEETKEKEHRERLDTALKTRSTAGLDEDELRNGLWYRKMHRVENKYEDRLRDEVLTVKQRPVWDAYRLHFASAFQLSFTGIGTAGAEKLAPICEQVVKDVTAPPTTAGRCSRSGSRR